MEKVIEIKIAGGFQAEPEAQAPRPTSLLPQASAPCPSVPGQALFFLPVLLMALLCPAPSTSAQGTDAVPSPAPSEPRGRGQECALSCACREPSQLCKEPPLQTRELRTEDLAWHPSVCGVRARVLAQLPTAEQRGPGVPHGPSGAWFAGSSLSSTCKLCRIRAPTLEISPFRSNTHSQPLLSTKPTQHPQPEGQPAPHPLDTAVAGLRVEGGLQV